MHPRTGATLAVALFVRDPSAMSTHRNTDIAEIGRHIEYLKELSFLTPAGERPPLDLLIEMFHTTDAILKGLMRMKPGMMAERDGYARISRKQASLMLETDGEELCALVGMMLAPMMFILVCGDG